MAQENIETQETQETQEQKPQTKRETVVARMREKYPDRNMDDEEELYGAIDDDYNGTQDELNGYKEREQGLTDMFNNDPRSAAFLNNWRQGSDPVVELIRMFGDDFKGALEDPERQEALAQANKEYIDRVTQNKQYEEEYEKNMGETLANIEVFQKETGATTEEVDAAVTLLGKIFSDLVRGKVEMSSLGLAMKAVKHGEDVANARHEGEVAGRNAKIEEKLRKATGDGVPNIGGSGAPAGGEGQKQIGLFDYVDAAK